MDDILMQVTKPGRYIGNEWNSIHKNIDEVDIRFALAFPDLYEVGMSHLGSKILYHLLNERNDTFCERVFAPWTDMEGLLRSRGIKLFTLESRTPLNKMDIVGFTLQYEMSYSNIINILSLSNIPLRSSKRTTQDPFVIAGGPCAYNPEPLADFIDFFVLGEGEEIINEILNIFKDWKNNKGSREEFLLNIAQLDGIYVPSMYNVTYNENGTILKVEPLREAAKPRIKKVIVKDVNNLYYPERPIVPYIETVHDRIMLEVFRGCTRGCRFCQAGMIYRPIREKAVEKLIDLAKKSIRNTGYDEISLSSLSTSDYSKLEPLIDNLMEDVSSEGVSISLPSLRLDSFSLNLAKKVQKVRKSGLTFAPEAGTQRLRNVINKGIEEDDLYKAVGDAFEMGWNSVKLYFMIGLPTETMDDVEGIAKLAYKVLDIYKVRGKKGNWPKITISTSSFVPKPFTPFQWEGQFPMEVLVERQNYLKQRLKRKSISYNWHDARLSFLEGVFSRGDRRLGKVLEEANKLGCKFDGWADEFSYEKWMAAFNNAGINPEFYNLRERNLDEILPWDHIDVGVTKEYLIKEREKAMSGDLTHDCRVNRCLNCGINRWGGIC